MSDYYGRDDCGTVSSYRRHIRRYEEPCGRCRAANAAYERGRRVVAPAAPRQLVPCGSPSAWRRHKRRGEKPCDACVEAHRAEVVRYAGRRAS